MTDHSSLIIAPTSFEEVIRDLAAYEERDFEYLLEEVRGPEAFDVNSARCRRLGSRLKRSPEAVAFMLRAFGFIYSQLGSAGEFEIETGRVVNDFVQSFEFELDGHLHARLIQRLVDLCSRNPETDAAIRFQEMRKGFLDNLTSIDSYVDLRPDFNKENSKIQSLIPIVQLRLMTNSNDPRLRDIVLQVDAETIEMISEKIKEIKKALTHLTDVKIGD